MRSLSASIEQIEWQARTVGVGEREGYSAEDSIDLLREATLKHLVGGIEYEVQHVLRRDSPMHNRYSCTPL